ncbi:MAG: hypothetical protein JWO98_5120 [Frankiales bacterium]|nr:hypothetical protein [Frankiales bacterium]
MVQGFVFFGEFGCACLGGEFEFVADEGAVAAQGCDCSGLHRSGVDEVGGVGGAGEAGADESAEDEYVVVALEAEPGAAAYSQGVRCGEDELVLLRGEGEVGCLVAFQAPQAWAGSGCQ